LLKDLIYKWFYNYTASFLKNDDSSPYALKYQHTIRVAQNAKKIAIKNNFPEPDINLAETIGLLHDCGRFQQFAQYGTFNDRLSEDHAELSARLISSEKLLSKLNKTDSDIILKAVAFHNKKTLPTAELTDRELKFARIVRDADKVDIYHVMANQLKNPQIDHKTLFLNQSEEVAFSAPILDAIKNQHIANIEDMKTEVDFRMIQLSWVFDINFPASLELIKTQGNLNYLIDVLPAKELVKDELNIIKKQIDYEK